MILRYVRGCWFLHRRDTDRYQYLCEADGYRGIGDAMRRYASLRSIGGIFV